LSQSILKTGVVASSPDAVTLYTPRSTSLKGADLERIEQQARKIDLQRRDIEGKQKLIERKDRDIAWRDAKLEKINFELARLKRWKFGAKSDAMNSDQRRMFQDDRVAEIAARAAEWQTDRGAPETSSHP